MTHIPLTPTLREYKSMNRIEDTATIESAESGGSGGLSLDSGLPATINAIIFGDGLVMEGSGTLVLCDASTPGFTGGLEATACSPDPSSPPVSGAAAARRIRRLVAKLWERMNDEGRAGLREFLKSLASLYEEYNHG